MDKINIIYTEYGLADRIGADILINKELKKNSELHAWVLRHEKEHTGQLTIQDIQHDLVINKKHNRKMSMKLLAWQFLHPKTWTQLIPVRIYKGETCWDVSLIILWTIAIIILWIAIKIII